MELNRRHLLSLGMIGAGAAGLTAAGVPLAGPAGAATVPGVTDVLFLTGTDAENTVDWDFQVASGRRSGVAATIPTPSNWEAKGFGTYTYGGSLVPAEIGRYRHSFTPPAGWAGRRIFLVFEGVMTDAQVSVNGTSAGAGHQGGFYRFRYDVTALLRLGQANLLEVTVSKDSADSSVNDAERRGDFWNFGGIFRPVTLQAFPTARIDRVALNAQASGAFSADVMLAGVSAAGRVVGQLKNLDGTDVGAAFSVAVAAGAGRATLSTTLTGAAQWTAETPSLYLAEFRLVAGDGSLLHTVTERFGFRTVEVRAGAGVFVNGHKIMLKGTNRHTLWPTLGRASSPRLARQDILLMKEMNNNAVRMSHYPPDAFFLDLCDELGLYVLDELAGWQHSYSEAAGAPLVAAMVQRDVNHPSILFWDNGNEGGWNTALDDDFALYDPQRRAVLHPFANFSGIDAAHYQTYNNTRTKLAAAAIFMPTEFQHGLYDGGAGAGLNDYWTAMVAAPRSAGGFIWGFADESIVRDDRSGAIDSNGNAGPDGVLGPFREKEGSFFTIRDIWSPVQLSNAAYYATTFPAGFDQTVKVVNRFDVTNLRQCAFAWQLLRFADPGAASTAPTVLAQGTATAPDTAPGLTATVALGLPATWADADALRFTAADPTGREVNGWVWTIRKAADLARRIVVPPATGTVTATETAAAVTLTAGGTRVTISRTTGRLTGVTRDGVAVSLTNGPALATGTATFAGLTHRADGTGHVVEATYTGDLSLVRWRLDADGWLRLEYAYRLTGNRDFLGVNLDYPEARVRGITWLGNGPFRVYKNRLRGVQPGVWTKAFNNTATGAAGFTYPEFKGYHSGTYWAALSTTEGTITLVAAQENLFLRLFTPASGPDPRNAVVAYPGGNISLLDAIAPIGYKQLAAADQGPESQPNVATGDYRRTVYFRFTA